MISKSLKDRHILLVWCTLLLATACGPAQHTESEDNALGIKLRKKTKELAEHGEQTKDKTSKYISAVTDKQKRQQLLQEFLRKRDLESLANRNAKLFKKLREGAPTSTDTTITDSMDDHTTVYPMSGQYKILVIPVQFQDTKFERPEFFQPLPGGESQASTYLFGDDPNTLTSYYRHASLGKFHVDGVISPIITAKNDLAFYGESMGNGVSDRNAKELVAESVGQLKNLNMPEQWWTHNY